MKRWNCTGKLLLLYAVLVCTLLLFGWVVGLLKKVVYIKQIFWAPFIYSRIVSTISVYYVEIGVCLCSSTSSYSPDPIGSISATVWV